jgi:hypothetical protein
MKISRNTHDLVTGDAKTLLVTLLRGAVPFVIPPGSNVRAILQRSTMTTPLDCPEVQAGASWSTGVVAVPFTSLVTAALSTGEYSLEIQVQGVDTWFFDKIIVRRGEIPG